MKTNLLITLLAVGVLAPALAQYKPVGDDGIAASPKLRQTLDTLNPAKRAPAIPVVTVKLAGPAVFGSPKFNETWATPKVLAAAPVATKDHALAAGCTGYKVLATPKAMASFPQAKKSCCGMPTCVVACTR